MRRLLLVVLFSVWMALPSWADPTYQEVKTALELHSDVASLSTPSVEIFGPQHAVVSHLLTLTLTDGTVYVGRGDSLDEAAIDVMEYYIQGKQGVPEDDVE